MLTAFGLSAIATQPQMIGISQMEPLRSIRSSLGLTVHSLQPSSIISVPRISVFQHRALDAAYEIAKAAQLNRLFFGLPPEIREIILLYSMLPLLILSTASIPNTPDHIQIPAVAHVCHSLRDEALAIFYRNRPLEITVYSTANEKLTETWLSLWDETEFKDITIIGKGSQHHFFKFRINLHEQGLYSVAIPPEFSSLGQDMTVVIAAVERWLAKRQAREQEYGLNGCELKALVQVVMVNP
jgi:hypothetical protein